MPPLERRRGTLNSEVGNARAGRFELSVTLRLRHPPPHTGAVRITIDGSDAPESLEFCGFLRRGPFGFSIIYRDIAGSKGKDVHFEQPTDLHGQPMSACAPKFARE